METPNPSGKISRNLSLLPSQLDATIEIEDKSQIIDDNSVEQDDEEDTQYKVLERKQVRGDTSAPLHARGVTP